MNVWLELRKFCREKDIDLLVNLSGVGEVSLTLFLASFFTKAKFFIYFNGDPKINIRNSLILFTQFFAYKILSASNDVNEKLKRILFPSKNKLHYLPHPVNVHLFKPNNQIIARRKLGINKKEKVCIFVGRIEPEKGSDILLKLIKRNPDKKFILLGDLVDNNYKKESLRNILITHVPHKEVVNYYNAADLCLFLTKRDGYSYIPRESIASGTPAIISNLKAFEQLQTEAIIKVTLDNDNLIQKKIDWFFSLSKKEIDAISQKGRQFIINDSSEEAIKPAVLDIFLN